MGVLIFVAVLNEDLCRCSPSLLVQDRQICRIYIPASDAGRLVLSECFLNDHEGTWSSVLCLLLLVSVEPGVFHMNYNRLQTPTHRCNDICSARSARIVETIDCKFKY
jgi:hypothetical protein